MGHNAIRLAINGFLDGPGCKKCKNKDIRVVTLNFWGHAISSTRIFCTVSLRYKTSKIYGL